MRRGRVTAANDIVGAPDSPEVRGSQPLVDDHRNLLIDAGFNLLLEVVRRQSAQLPRYRIESDLLSEPRLVALPVVFEDLWALGVNLLDKPVV